MKRTIHLLFFIIALLGALSARGAVYDTNYKITVDGVQRSGILYVPDNPGTNPPLLIGCHGFNMTNGSIRDALDMKEICDTAKLIVFYPAGLQVTTNDNSKGGGWEIWSAPEQNRDVKLILAIIEEMSTKYSIDRERVYMAGFSMGGMFCYYCMNCIGDKIAAFAPNSGYPVSWEIGQAKFTSSRPIPIIHHHGTWDGVVPFTAGGNSSYPAAQYPDNAQTIINGWVARNQCSSTPTVSTLPTSYKTITRYFYGNGLDGAEVELRKIDGWGHSVYKDDNETTYHTGNEIWKFLRRYTINGKIGSNNGGGGGTEPTSDVVWENAAGTVLNWNVVASLTAAQAAQRIHAGDKVRITVTAVDEGWPQVALSADAEHGWNGLVINQGVGGMTYPYEAEFAVTKDLAEQFAATGFSVTGAGATVSKVEIVGSGIKVTDETAWFGPETFSWGHSLSIPASVFANLNYGDKLVFEYDKSAAEATMQVVLGNWGGLVLNTYQNPAGLERDETTGTITLTFLPEYATTPIVYNDKDGNVTATYPSILDAVKDKGVVIQGPITLKRIDFLNVSNYSRRCLQISNISSTTSNTWEALTYFNLPQNLSTTKTYTLTAYLRGVGDGGNILCYGYGTDTDTYGNPVTVNDDLLPGGSAGYAIDEEWRKVTKTFTPKGTIASVALVWGGLYKEDRFYVGSLEIADSDGNVVYFNDFSGGDCSEWGVPGQPHTLSVVFRPGDDLCLKLANLSVQDHFWEQMVKYAFPEELPAGKYLLTMDILGSDPGNMRVDIEHTDGTATYVGASYNMLADRWSRVPQTFSVEKPIKKLMLSLGSYDGSYVYLNNLMMKPVSSTTKAPAHDVSDQIANLIGNHDFAEPQFSNFEPQQSSIAMSLIENTDPNLAIDGTLTGIEDVKVEAAAADDGEGEYYDMHGVRIDNPGPGIYIERRGQKAVKVVRK